MDALIDRGMLAKDKIANAGECHYGHGGNGYSYNDVSRDLYAQDSHLEWYENRLVNGSS